MVVGVTGIVMKWYEVLHLGERREVERLLERTVSPADVLGILVRAVLAVVNKQIRVGGK